VQVGASFGASLSSSSLFQSHFVGEGTLHRTWTGAITAQVWCKCASLNWRQKAVAKEIQHVAEAEKDQEKL
jgi:hypothetical protein